jgi:hypothetical protein
MFAHLRLEDANFQGKTIPEIENMKKAKQKQIEVPGHFIKQKIFTKSPSNYLNGLFFYFTLQACIEDIENAQSTVKSWKSRACLN